MKGKKYAFDLIEKIEQAEKDRERLSQVLGQFGNDFVKEFDEMRIERNIGKGAKEQSLVNLINEFSRKYVKICQMVNEYFANDFDGLRIMRYRGFLKMLRLINPGYIDIIKRYNL